MGAAEAGYDVAWHPMALFSLVQQKRLQTVAKYILHLVLVLSSTNPWGKYLDL